jgi:hypothetical protein
MLLHYVAAGQITIVLLVHLARGGKGALFEYSMGNRVSLPVLFNTWNFGIGFLLVSAILISMPTVFDWLKIIIAVLWISLGVVILVMNSAITSGSYFGLSTGVLIALGVFL